MIVCAGDKESFSFATPIGTGMIKSAMNLTRLIMFDKPEFILFIGSAGSYTKKHNILDIAESSDASQIEQTFFDSKSYTPIDNAMQSQTSFIKSQTIVNSSNYINSSDSNYDNFIKNNITLENMEFFTILTIAKEFQIPAGGIFVVTNYTNKDAHNDFEKNHSEAMGRLTEYVREKGFVE